MKKILLILFGLVIVAATGISVYVSTIDWNQHKGKIAEQLQEITGKKIVFSGPVSMTVFPTPSLNASNIKVYSSVNPDKEEPLMTIDNVVADLSFSALLGGSFDVKMMSLVRPEINFHRTADGFNWSDEAKINADAEVKDVTIALESVMLQDAKVNITDDVLEKNVVLNSLNAEIIADSLNGPFRIDGSYVKDGKPEGFAISVGSLSENFATNLNLVLNQPFSESYLRFDGTFLLSNSTVNGNLIIESKKFKAFYDSMIKGAELPQYWDYPFELSMELKVNKAQVEFANAIIKYGDSVGAGNVIIPLRSKSYIIGEDEGSDKREITAKFEMTNLNLEPFFYDLKEFISQQMQEDAVYSPDYPFDVSIDISALKAIYNNQAVKNFALQLGLHDNVWQLLKIDGTFPGTTTVTATGKLFSVEDVLSYTMSVDVKSTLLRKFLEWIDIPVKTVANSTYQKANLQTTIVGTSKALQLSPFTLFLDNTSFTGQLGAKLGKEPHYAIELATDSIILDNYFPKIFGDKENWRDALQENWSKLTQLDNIDLDLNLRAALLIYEGTSLDKVSLSATSQKGVVNIEKLSIGEVLKSSVDLSGEFSGLGKKLQFSNLKYDLKIADYLPWLQKFDIQQPDWNIKFFQPFSSSGVVSLNNDRLWLNIANKTGSFESTYNGRVMLDDSYSVNGEVQFLTPNASDFLKSIPIKYIPQDANLGRMQLKSKISGSWDKFKLSEALLSIGGSVFQGTFGADQTRQIPYFVADLKVSHFEPERFLLREENASQFNKDSVSGNGNTLWNKPNLSEVPFNKEKLQKVTFVSNLNIDELVYNNKLFKSVTVQMENKNNELSVKKLQSNFNEGSVTADLKYNYADKPTVKGDIHIINQNVRDMNWVGNLYGVQSGMAEVNINVNTSALSPRDVLDNFTGALSINIDSPLIKGINFAAISADLAQRKASEGFQNVLRDNLQQGETSFNKFSAQIDVKEGSWQIDRAWLKSNEASVDIKGNGNLKAWNMDSQFVVQLSEPKNAKPFSFDLKGLMSSPELEIDGSQITKVYDEQKAQKEAEEKAQKEAHDRDLISKMEIQAVALKKAREGFDAFAHNEFLSLKEKLSKEKYTQEMKALEQRVQKQLSEFDKADLIVREKELKDSMPQMVAQVVADAKVEQERILDDLQKIYRLDLKGSIRQNYEEIKKINSKKESIMQENLSKHETHVIRLNNIETGYRFQNDAMYNQLLGVIEDRLKNYDALTQNVERYGSGVDSEEDVPLLEKYKDDSLDILEKATSQEALLEDDINRYLSYVDEKLKVEEKIFKDKKEAEEKAKLIEENTGTISAPATGKVQTVVRRVEEIEGTDSSETTSDEYEPKIEVNLFGDDQAQPQVSGTVSKK